MYILLVLCDLLFPSKWNCLQSMKCLIFFNVSVMDKVFLIQVYELQLELSLVILLKKVPYLNKHYSNYHFCVNQINK